MPEMSGVYLIIVRQSNKGSYGVSAFPELYMAEQMLDAGFPHREPLEDAKSYSFSKEDVNGKHEGIVGIDFIPMYSADDFQSLGGVHDSKTANPKPKKRARSERTGRKECPDIGGNGSGLRVCAGI